MGDGYADRSPKKNQVGFADPKEVFMILTVCVKLKDIFEQGRNFNWIKPKRCPRCRSVRIWGHGFVTAYFGLGADLLSTFDRLIQMGKIPEKRSGENKNAL